MLTTLQPSYNHLAEVCVTWLRQPVLMAMISMRGLRRTFGRSRLAPPTLLTLPVSLPVLPAEQYALGAAAEMGRRGGKIMHQIKNICKQTMYINATVDVRTWRSCAHMHLQVHACIRICICNCKAISIDSDVWV